MIVVGAPAGSSGRNICGITNVWFTSVVLNAIDTEPLTENRFPTPGIDNASDCPTVSRPATPPTSPAAVLMFPVRMISSPVACPYGVVPVT